LPQTLYRGRARLVAAIDAEVDVASVSQPRWCCLAAAERTSRMWRLRCA
jgi:hypothetical protein